MSYFLSPPLFIVPVFLISLIVLQLLLISITSYLISTLTSNFINSCLGCPFLDNYNFVLKSCTIFGFLNFHFSHLIYEKFNLCLQNTINMLKTARVYFGVLQERRDERE